MGPPWNREHLGGHAGRRRRDTVPGGRARPRLPVRRAAPARPRDRSKERPPDRSRTLRRGLRSRQQHGVLARQLLAGRS